MHEEHAPNPRNRIGNDVMDLLHPRCEKRARTDPLLDRILTPEERAWLDTTPDEAAWTIGLWALWAAKEAAFKVFCKLGAGEPFIPKVYRCRLRTAALEGSPFLRIQGTVRHRQDDTPVTVDGSSNRSYVHLIAWNGSVERPRRDRLEIGIEEMDEDTELSLDDLRSRFTAEEWAGIYSLRSARARLLARARIRSHLPTLGLAPPPALGEGRVEIRTPGERPGRAAPRIWFDGSEVEDLDLSLSHHGRFVAWALLVRES